MRCHAFYVALVIVSLTVSNLISQDNTFPGLPPALSGGPDRPADQPAPRGVESSKDVVLENCTISELSRVVVSASEAGRLIQGPTLGAEVIEDELVAKTDDKLARYQQRIAYFAYEAEKVKLETDIQERYAEKQAEVSEASYRETKEASDKIKNAVSANVVRQRLFEWQGAKLGIEKATHDMQIARAGAEVKLAEYEAADAMVKRHQIKSPVTGVVEKVLKHKGEWVTPSEPIAEIVQLDRVRVTGRIKIDRAPAPGKLKGLQVTLDVPVERDVDGNGTQFRTMQGKIMHVGASVTDALDYDVWVEVENTEDRILWPGAPGVMMKLELP